MMAALSATPSRQRLGGFAGFAVASCALIAVAGLGLSLAFKGPGDAQALLISAVLAWATQLAAFPIVRRLTSSSLVAGWGAGTLVRMGTLLVYALLGALVFKLSMTPALVGLALFYFVSMVIEPLFLRS
jgi:hypothetical protein